MARSRGRIEFVEIDGKCKFPHCKVVFVGNKKDATDYMIANEPRSLNAAIIGASLEVGDHGAIAIVDFVPPTNMDFAAVACFDILSVLNPGDSYS